MPAGHLAMDTHFKLLHAHEEIDWLNVEICCFTTHLQTKTMAFAAMKKHSTQQTLPLPTKYAPIACSEATSKPIMSAALVAFPKC